MEPDRICQIIDTIVDLSPPSKRALLQDLASRAAPVLNVDTDVVFDALLKRILFRDHTAVERVLNRERDLVRHRPLNAQGVRNFFALRIGEPQVVERRRGYTEAANWTDRHRF